MPLWPPRFFRVASNNVSNPTAAIQGSKNLERSLLALSPPQPFSPESNRLAAAARRRPLLRRTSPVAVDNNGPAEEEAAGPQFLEADRRRGLRSLHGSVRPAAQPAPSGAGGECAASMRRRPNRQIRSNNIQSHFEAKCNTWMSTSSGFLIKFGQSRRRTRLNRPQSTFCVEICSIE